MCNPWAMLHCCRGRTGTHTYSSLSTVTSSTCTKSTHRSLYAKTFLFHEPDTTTNSPTTALQTRSSSILVKAQLNPTFNYLFLCGRLLFFIFCGRLTILLPKCPPAILVALVTEYNTAKVIQWVNRAEKKKIKIPGSSLPFILKAAGEILIDARRVYEATFAVNSPTKPCHATETSPVMGWRLADTRACTVHPSECVCTLTSLTVLSVLE